MADDPRGESSDRPTSPTPDGSTTAAGEIFKAIEPQAPPVAPSAQPHILEAAAPKRAAVGRSMRVLAMIRRTKSAGLKAFVEIEETAPPAVEGMGDKPFRLEIPLDQEGTPQSAEIALTLDSPDFHPKSQTKNLTLPAGRDSELCTFLLTPKVAGELLLSLGVFIASFKSWLGNESGYDEETWPKLKKALNQERDRVGARRLFKQKIGP